MADEPSWDDIFRPAGSEPAKPPQQPVTPQQQVPPQQVPQQYPPTAQYPAAAAYPGVRATDPFAVAAAEATSQSTRIAAPGGEAPTRRQLREQAEAGGGRGGRGGDATPREPKPKKKRRGLIVVLSILVVLLLAGTAGGTYVWLNYESKVREVLGWELPNDYTGTGNGQEAIVIVQSGDIGSDIARKLHEEEVTMTFDAVYDYLVANPDITFEPGNYRLQKEMSAESAVAALRDPANRLVNQVLIREGMFASEAFEQLSVGLDIPLEDFTTAAADYTQFGIPAESPGIEGWLFPATYTFDPGMTAVQVIQALVDKMFEVLDRNGVAPDQRLDTLKMAALVQRESGPVLADMPKIARVFFNRLEQGMLFQSDATVSYGTGNPNNTVWTTNAERADAGNLYNTYVHPGLPYGPIGLPGEDAIKAAIAPADGPWLYFVPINLASGETVFSETNAQHEAAVNQLRAWCRASEENASYCA